MILSWPGTVAAGETEALVSHIDFLASFAAMAEFELPHDAAPDSLNMLSVLLGQSATGREELITEGTQAKTVLRQGDWVLIPPYDGPAVFKETNIESGCSREIQLFHLSQDIGQIRNLASEQQDRVRRMSARLETMLRSNRTRP